MKILNSSARCNPRMEPFGGLMAPYLLFAFGVARLRAKAVKTLGIQVYNSLIEELSRLRLHSIRPSRLISCMSLVRLA